MYQAKASTVYFSIALKHHFHANIMGETVISFQSIEGFVIDFFGARM